MHVLPPHYDGRCACTVLPLFISAAACQSRVRGIVQSDMTRIILSVVYVLLSSQSCNRADHPLVVDIA